MAVKLCFLFNIQRARLPLLFFILLSSSSFSPCQRVSATILTPKHTNDNATTDRSSLLVFNSAISVDPYGVFSGWNDTVHFCKWQGITCGGHRHPDRVVALELPALDLVGIISPALANLTFLRSINLFSNQFNGQIPSQLANLSRLERLDLSSNSLQGYIPSEYGAFPSLIVLNFMENILTGQIPPTLANVSSLVALFLSNNNLSGVIPPTLGKLPNLSFLDLGSNNLVGVIPPAIWNLSSLKNISLYSNRLYGSLPQDIGRSLPNLKYLGVCDNSLHGEIPLSLANASQLHILELGKNKFSGTIPPNLGKLQYLTQLRLYENQLEATKPNDWIFLASLTNCTFLTDLWLHDNNLGGQLPKSLANFSRSIINLVMGDNYINGRIPKDIGNLVSLTYLNLGQNSLTGPIPASFVLLNNLRKVHLYKNNLSGEIPHEIGNLTQLETFWLGYNSLDGSIPTSFSKCKLLGSLHLGYNMLTETIPKELFSIHTLYELSLGNNLLQGSIPSEVGSLINLNMLIVSSNNLSGEIPFSFGSCISLVNLFLQGNLFHGSIPTSLSALRGLQELDLSRNNLSGEVPVFFGYFPFLYDLNLSFNNFEGELPTKGVFGNTSAVSVVGNPKLCGGNPMLHLQTCHFSSPKKKHKSYKIAVIISVSSVFLLLLFVLAIVFYLNMQKKSTRKLVTNNDVGDQYVNVSYAELDKATNGFSEENLVGSGSLACVYRGKLENPKYNATDVAVKVFNLQQPEALKSFRVECNAFRNIRHRNLIKIITACSSVDFKGNDFKALIFEFKANGSLEDWLHPEKNVHEINKLSLVQRMNIIVDVASAVEYLHSHGQTPIIHCDLKPSNILLNDDMMALVSDFGIVRCMDKSMKNSTSSSGIKGTMGYIPPEYGMANKVSTHGDVYSFGILLLELFTGRRPTDVIFQEGLSLRSFVEIALPEKIMNVIDVHILQDDSDEPSKFAQSVDNTRSLECVTSVLVIGLSCTEDLPIDRMEMRNVTNELKTIRNRFLAN